MKTKLPVQTIECPKSGARRFIKRILGQRLVDRCIAILKSLPETRVYGGLILIQGAIGQLLPVPWYRCGWKIRRTISLAALRDDTAVLGISIRRIREEEPVSLKPPKKKGAGAIDPVFGQYLNKVNPEFSLLEIPGGYGFDDGKNIGVLTSFGTLLEGVATSFENPHGRHPIQLLWNLPPVCRLRGRALFLSTAGAATNYYHWTMELLPKLHGLSEAGVELDSFDHILVNSMAFPFQRESLELLGVPASKLICTGSDGNGFVTCDYLVVPTHTCHTIPPRWALEFLRLSVLPSKKSRPVRRLYVSRADARYRRLVNEPEVTALLARSGFEIVTLAELSLRQQAALFSEAAAIISVHGAGLANLAFAPSGCKIAELFSPGYIYPFYWGIAATLAIDYTYLTGFCPDEQSQRSVTADLTVNLTDLETLLKEWDLDKDMIRIHR